MYASALAPPQPPQTSNAENAVVPDCLTAGECLIKLHSRQLVFENTVFSVFADHLSGAGGHETLGYLNVVPKCAASDQVTGVAILPVRDGRIGLIHVYRHPVNRWSWEVPKGFLDTGELPEQAATRELREETGFQIQAYQFMNLGTMAPEPGVVAGRIRLFVAILEAADSYGTSLGELGHGCLAFFNRNEVTALITSGKIEDGCTLAIMLKYILNQQG